MIEKLRKYLLLLNGVLHQKKAKKSESILILFSAAFGDAILFQDCMRELVYKYPYEGKKRLRILCRQSVKDFYINSLGFSERYFCKCTYTKNLKDIKNAIKELGSESYKSIYAKDGALETCVIVSNLRASKVIRVTSEVEMNSRNPVNRYLVNKCFTDTTIVPMDTWELNRHAILLNRYDNIQVNPVVSNMKSVLNLHPYFDNNKMYVVISTDSSAVYRTWNAEKISEIIHFITETYDYDVVLCGTNEYTVMDTSNRLINLTGKTSFSEWFSIIQFSKLVIGVDSAAIHVALSLGTPAVVLRGYYEGKKYFPYPVEACNGNICKCVTSKAEYNCYLCLQRKNIIKKKNPICYSQCYKKKGIMSCLNNINVGQVKDAIREIL